MKRDIDTPTIPKHLEFQRRLLSWPRPYSTVAKCFRLRLFTSARIRHAEVKKSKAQAGLDQSLTSTKLTLRGFVAVSIKCIFNFSRVFSWKSPASVRDAQNGLRKQISDIGHDSFSKYKSIFFFKQKQHGIKKYLHCRIYNKNLALH